MHSAITPRAAGDSRKSSRFGAVVPVLVWLAGAVLAAAPAGWVVYRISFDRAVGEALGAARYRLDLFSASLEREIQKFAAFPYVTTYDRAVIDLGRHPIDAERIAAANAYLERLNDRVGTLAMFMLDAAGRCIASSNWNRPDSFVGRDLSYRPYYRNVGIDHIERFYGIGTTNNEPGLFLSTALHDGARVIGTTVTKVGLEQLERSWSSAEAPALVADEHGVVVLASVPAWKYGTLHALSPKERADIADTQQYNGRALAPIGLVTRHRLDADASIVELSGVARAPNGEAAAGLFLALTRPIPDMPLRLTVFSDLAEAVAASQSRAVLAGVVALFLVGALAAFRQRRRHLRQMDEARAALQRAHDDLERTVSERTSELVVANTRLVEEVEVRSRAERTLREAQAGLVQAGKLAVLGQLSAGVAHELNQPLAALATLSGNTIKFLERGDTATATANLERIRPLVDRMGRLTGELKSFARKSSGEPQPIPIRKAVDNALFLLDHRVARGSVTVDVEIEAGVSAWGDPNRLEQVLVNLLGNALDAMEGQPERRLRLAARRAGRDAVIEVHDSGPGLPDDLIAHLFEPFFTTKAPGLGLGLGLAISAGIVRDFGGSLSAENAEGGGARFVITLPAEKETPL